MARARVSSAIPRISLAALFFSCPSVPSGALIALGCPLSLFSFHPEQLLGGSLSSAAGSDEFRPVILQKEPPVVWVAQCFLLIGSRWCISGGNYKIPAGMLRPAQSGRLEQSGDRGGHCQGQDSRALSDELEGPLVTVASASQPTPSSLSLPLCSVRTLKYQPHSNDVRT